MHTQNLAFIDTETTGFDPEKQEIIQIGLVLISQEEENGVTKYKILEELDLKVKPAHIETAEPGALRVNGYDEADWVFAYSLKEAMTILAKKTEGAIMVAHNLPFDYGFLMKAFSMTGIPNKMHFHKLDTISIAFAKSKKRGDIDKFSLHHLCSIFGIENKKAHTALADARATYELYKKLLAL